MKGGKRETDESPKGKPLSKNAEAGTSCKDKEVNKGKRQYISTIIGGAPKENLSLKEP